MRISPAELSTSAAAPSAIARPSAVGAAVPPISFPENREEPF